MSRFREMMRGCLIYVFIIIVTLVLADLALMATGLFPPTHDYGHPVAGWVAAEPSSEMRREGCLELTSGQRLEFVRNEDGYRTTWPADSLAGADSILEIAVGGDSHTELCAANERTHFGYLESSLRESGVNAAVYAFGAGKYSPLQAYLALRESFGRYETEVFVLNLYTGNDFYDMLRVDDRPYLERPEGEQDYRIAEPVWYRHDPPGEERRSRVLFALRSIAQQTGVRLTYLRLRYLQDVAREQGAGMGTIFGYMNDLRRSGAPEVAYPQAFTAQMLNQQLFFHRFPETRAESLRRIDALLRMIRREHPGMLLVVSPIPSYQLTNVESTNASLERVLERLPLTYEGGVQAEEALYEELRTLSGAAGWVFVDNLPELRSHSARDSLFNVTDYHIEPVASEIIGRREAEVIRQHFSGRSDVTPATTDNGETSAAVD